MTIHPLVTQLHFARSEFMRCLDGVSEEDAMRRVMPMNCISWYIGHLANQEQAYWVFIAQNKLVVPGLNDLVGYGKPASTPPLKDMLAAWHTVTQAADEFLNTLTSERLTEYMTFKGKPRPESIGTMLQRNLYHYWFHTGEAYAAREMLGHPSLPEFVGDMTSAVYRPESA
jgi:uncharacterized damage-inducible protein DinB